MVEMACATSAASADCLGHRLNPTGLNGTDSIGRTRSRPLCGTVTECLNQLGRGATGANRDGCSASLRRCSGPDPRIQCGPVENVADMKRESVVRSISNAIPRVIFSPTVDRTGRVMLGQCSGLTRLADYEAAGPYRSAGN